MPGLQVRMPDGTWVDVPDVPGSFAVNSGDMMRPRWAAALRNPLAARQRDVA